MIFLTLHKLYAVPVRHILSTCDPKYLNVIKAEQLMVGKQLLVSTSLINPFRTSIIDQQVPESIKLIGFYRCFPQVE